MNAESVRQESVRQSLRGRSSAETRSAILDLIRLSGEITRVDLSRQSGLTEATISKVVNELMANGLISASGRAESTGGKPATFLRLDTSQLGAVGIVLDLPHIVIVLCAIDGSVIEPMTIAATRDEEPEVVLARIAASISELLEHNDMSPDRVIGMGVALSGRRSYRGPNPLDWWETMPIDERLQELTGIDVLLENDANCAALNEFWSGGISPGQDFAVVYAADGIGAGIVIGGDVYRGRSSHAGEIGHVYVDRNQTPCWCGRQGCLEVTGTPQAVARRARDMPELFAGLGVDADGSTRAIYAALARNASAGDPEAHALITEAAEYVATAVVGMANTLDLGLVVLAGPGFGSAGAIYLEAVRAAVDATYIHSVHPVEVRLRSVEPNIAALGAASLVLHRRLTPHHAA
jgi:predicted NBD/HSP70 family sugar kinase